MREANTRETGQHKREGNARERAAQERGQQKRARATPERGQHKREGNGNVAVFSDDNVGSAGAYTRKFFLGRRI